MEGLRSANEIRQAEAAGELAEWLLMANEDSLPTHLPIREIVQSLIQLLQMEHNFELVGTKAERQRQCSFSDADSSPMHSEPSGSHPTSPANRHRGRALSSGKTQAY